MLCFYQFSLKYNYAWFYIVHPLILSLSTIFYHTLCVVIEIRSSNTIIYVLELIVITDHVIDVHAWVLHARRVYQGRLKQSSLIINWYVGKRGKKRDIIVINMANTSPIGYTCYQYSDVCPLY